MPARNQTGVDVEGLVAAGFQPDSPEEAYGFVVTLLARELHDRAAEAVEYALALVRDRGDVDDVTVGRIHLVALRTALARGDGERAVGAANELPRFSGILPAEDLAAVLDAVRADRALHPEVRLALARVLEAVAPSPAGGVRPGGAPRAVDRSESVRFDEERDAAPVELPFINFGDSPDAADEHDGDLPFPGELVDPPAIVHGEEPGDPDEWIEVPGASDLPFLVVPRGLPLPDVIQRFIEGEVASAVEDPRRAVEMAWSLVLMESYDAASELFAKALPEETVRPSAVEGCVRCMLALGRASEAFAFVGRVRETFYGGGVMPGALVYWEGRAAEAAADHAAARAAYRQLSPVEFPDAVHRLHGMVA
jgi:hypothetical protein